MLHIYYGRENVDKDRFLFDRIAESMAWPVESGQTLSLALLVPDQYTLEAERSALSCLGVKGLMDLQVLSQSRLSERVLSETGSSGRVPIDRNGRHMLLWKVLEDEKDNLSVFRGMGKAPAFIEKMNNMISELKQHNAHKDRLSSILEEWNPEKGDSLLARKLSDIQRIYQTYQACLEGRYVDNEDHLDYFIHKLSASRWIRETEFFISGFDYFSPKSISIIGELIHYSKGVHVILTCDETSSGREIFHLTRRMMAKLEKAAENQPVNVTEITEPPAAAGPAPAQIEEQLFAPAPIPFSGQISPGDLVFCRAANFQSEAETAAAYIASLVRDKGLRYRDIAVICNDMEGRGRIIKRVFEEYGIHFFMDRKRSVMHNPVILFVSALLAIINEGWNREDVFRLLKTDFSPLSREDYEDLENYALRYKIRGNRWKKEFRYGAKELGDEELHRLNEMRETLVDFLSPPEEQLDKSGTVREKALSLRSFLEERANLPAHILAFSERLNQEEEYETALEMSQIWERLLGLLEQMTELAGDLVISADEFASMLAAGLESLELGLIPSTIDQVVIGTMQRTRVGKIKALVVIGANDGMLPKDPVDDDLLNRDEKALLLDRNVEICKDEDLRIMEERLSIYRNLSKPEQYLFLSYSASDAEGKELRPSVVFNQVRRMFPMVPLEKDIHNSQNPMDLIGGPKSTLVHLTEALRKAKSGESILEPSFKAAYNWYCANGSQEIAGVRRGLTFSNRVDRLEADLAQKLYQKRSEPDLILSPSRLERFGRCPFAHLVTYGFSPEERRVFEVAGREAGEIYHECLMKLAESLTAPDMEITDESSPFMQLTKEQCDEKVESLMDEIALEYKEGMLLSGQEEQYRARRMKEICKRAAFAMVEQVQQGRIRKIYFEEAFGSGQGRKFPPIKVDVGERTLLIEGKIDRVDILPGGYVKIIDYKSGKERFDLKEAKAGYRLQLMLYLRAAISGLKEKEERQEISPAGVFYFEIAEPSINVTGLSAAERREKLESELRKAFRLDGILLDDPQVIQSIDADFSGYSKILPLHKNKDGEVKGSSENKLLSKEDFMAFCEEVDRTIASLCASMSMGDIDIRPKKSGDATACDYCLYKSICNFDLSFDGCAYDVVK